MPLDASTGYQTLTSTGSWLLVRELEKLPISDAADVAPDVAATAALAACSAASTEGVVDDRPLCGCRPRADDATTDEAPGADGDDDESPARYGWCDVDM